MKILKHLDTPNTLIYLSIFLVTQIMGLLLSLVICFILQDFIWGFLRISLINSLILGLSLIGSCILSQQLMFKLKTFYILAISFSLILGISIISFFVILYSEPTLFIYYDRGAFSFLFVNFLFTIGLYIISSGLIIYREIMLEKEKTIGIERNLKKQMEMTLLTSKVNPHFLFNTLNMILNLLKEPEKAEIAILNLCDLLRHNLEQSEKSTISVLDEIDNVRKYLEIQSLRFGDKVTFSINGNTDFLIPPLIIQPLVENCIKHNISNVSNLSINIMFEQGSGRNTITVIDSEKKVDESMIDKGQGLTVTRKRVENVGGKFLIINGGIEISFSL